MLIDRIEFSLRLVLESPLTVGTGRLVERSDGEQGSIAEIHVDSFASDGAKPCIPATTLKGALRARWNSDGDRRDRLFGKIDRQGKGTAGTLLLYAALTADERGAVAPMKSAHGCIVFSRPATAIDRDTGAVADNKLFTQQAVAAGLEFDLPGVLVTDLSKAPEALQDSDAFKELAEAVAPLHSGISLGRSTRQGYGRLRLKNVAEVDVKRFNWENGYAELAAEQRQALVRHLSDLIETAATGHGAQGEPAVRLIATAKSPFIIRDPESDRSFAPRQDGVETRINVRNLKGPDDAPILWPSSFLGALRSRAAWLLELDRLRGRGKSKYVPETRSAADPVDDRFGEFGSTFGSSQRAVRHTSDLYRLTSVERLFGVPGWKGLLAVQALACTRKGRSRAQTSVAIDRLTGGAKDGALFTVEAVEGCVFEIDLALDASRLPQDLLARDRQFFGLLIDDVRDNGLMLGHGAARGYGWFDIAVNEPKVTP